MENQIAESRKVQEKDDHEKKEKSINNEEDFLSKQDSEESEKSCLTEEEELEEGEYLSDENSKKWRREATTMTTSESNLKKRKKHDNPIKESRYDDTFFDEWLFGTINHQKNGTNYKKADIKIGDDGDKDVMNTKLQRSSEAFVAFPRAQFLSQVGIFSLPYTVLF